MGPAVPTFKVLAAKLQQWGNFKPRNTADFEKKVNAFRFYLNALQTCKKKSTWWIQFAKYGLFKTIEAELKHLRDDWSADLKRKHVVFLKQIFQTNLNILLTLYPIHAENRWMGKLYPSGEVIKLAKDGLAAANNEIRRGASKQMGDAWGRSQTTPPDYSGLDHNSPRPSHPKNTGPKSRSKGA